MKNLIFLLLSLYTFIDASAQKEDVKIIREGNRYYNKENYSNSELSYRKALETAPGSYKATYNLGNSLYKQEKYEEAQNELNAIKEYERNKNDLARVYHNLGNSYLKKDQYKESIQAYKQALKYNPKDMDTKYNLAYAQKKLQIQQQQEQQNQKENQDQKENQNKDQQEKNQDQEQKQDQQQDQQQEQQISKQDAERMLEALQNQEKDLQEKLKKQQAQMQQVKILKDW